MCRRKTNPTQSNIWDELSLWAYMYIQMKAAFVLEAGHHDSMMAQNTYNAKTNYASLPG